MSWSGLKKAINRAGAQVLVKTGHLDQSHDKAFEFEEKRYRAMEASSEALYKELRRYMESLRTVMRSQKYVGESLASFYGNPDEILERLSRESQDQPIQEFQYPNLSQQFAHLLEKGIDDLEPVYNQTVLNPVARFNSYFVDVNEVIKKRQRKQLDYDALRGRQMKLEAKSAEATDSNEDTAESRRGSSDDANLPHNSQELEAAAEAYHVLNDQLKSDLPKLIDLRTPFLDPSFEAFVKIQLRFFNDNYNHLTSLSAKLDHQTKSDYLSGNLEARLDNVLANMKDLHIAS